MNQLKTGIIVYLVCFVGVVLISIFRWLAKKDPFDKVIFKSKFLNDICGETNGYSCWPISHFIMYVVLGLVAPDLWYIWLVVGIAWELVEYGGGKWLTSKGLQRVVNPTSKDTEDSQYASEWMGGSISDIIFNTTGLFTGMAIYYIHKAAKPRSRSRPRKKSAHVVK